MKSPASLSLKHAKYHNDRSIKMLLQFTELSNSEPASMYQPVMTATFLVPLKLQQHPVGLPHDNRLGYQTTIS